MSNKNFSSFENLVNLFTDLGNKLKTKVETVLLKNTVGWIGRNLLSISASVITKEENGITFKVNRNSNGEVTSVEVYGTATGNAFLYLYGDDNFAEENIFKNCNFNGCPAGGTGTSYSLVAQYWDTSSHTDGTNNQDHGNGNTILSVTDYIRIYIRVESGTNMGTAQDPKIFYPMIRSANEKDDTFEPAHKSVADSLDVWTPTATVSNGAVTFTNLNDAYNYSKPFFQDGLYTVTEMTKSGSGSAMSLTFATNAPDGTAAKLRIVN